MICWLESRLLDTGHWRNDHARSTPSRPLGQNHPEIFCSQRDFKLASKNDSHIFLRVRWLYVRSRKSETFRLENHFSAKCRPSVCGSGRFIQQTPARRICSKARRPSIEDSFSVKCHHRVFESWRFIQQTLAQRISSKARRLSIGNIFSAKRRPIFFESGRFMQ